MQSTFLRSIVLAVVAASSLAVKAEERYLFKFDNSRVTKSWQPVNDGVMGGRSVGRVASSEDQHMVFYGTLSLANNGGFASVRARGSNLALKKNDKVILRVKGDGREYQFNLYADPDLRGYSYRQSFKTVKDEWIEVELAVEDFVATWRGRTFPDEKLKPDQVTGLGFLLGDKQAGPFRLEVAWIRVSE